MAKQLIGHDIGAYIFNPALQTITFVGIPTITQDQILLITNTTDGIILYNFADASSGGTLAGNTLTLLTDTTTMSATDGLQVYIDIPTNLAVDTAAAHDAYTHLLLERIADLLEPMATQDSSNRQRVSVDAFPGTIATITTLGTLTTVTNAVPLGNLPTVGGVDGRYLFIDTARNAYAQGIRSNLTFTN